jgi:hypothetical protein
MRSLQDRAVALARASQKRKLDELAQAWRDVPGVRVTTGASDVTIEGRGLRWRRLYDPMLRFIGAGR